VEPSVEKLKVEPRMANGILSSANKTFKVTKLSLKLQGTNIFQYQELKCILEKTREMMRIKKLLLPLIMSQQTPKQELTKDLLDNQPTMETMATQLAMLFQVDLNSPTQIKELVNGGKLVSTNHIWLIESRFSTEEIAAVIDLQEPRSMLIVNSVDQLQVVQEMDNGMRSNAQNQSWVEK
jgi:hypothetical protein